MPNNMSVWCSGSLCLGFLGCLSKLAHVLSSMQHHCGEDGRRWVGAEAARFRPVAGLEMPCAWSGQGSQHHVLAQNNCLCGQLAPQLAESFLETLGLGYVLRSTTACVQTQKQGFIFPRKLPGSVRSPAADSVITK